MYENISCMKIQSDRQLCLKARTTTFSLSTLSHFIALFHSIFCFVFVCHSLKDQLNALAWLESENTFISNTCKILIFPISTVTADDLKKKKNVRINKLHTQDRGGKETDIYI